MPKRAALALAGTAMPKVGALACAIGAPDELKSDAEAGAVDMAARQLAVLSTMPRPAPLGCRWVKDGNATPTVHCGARTPRCPNCLMDRNAFCTAHLPLLVRGGCKDPQLCTRCWQIKHELSSSSESE